MIFKLVPDQKNQMERRAGGAARESSANHPEAALKSSRHAARASKESWAACRRRFGRHRRDIHKWPNQKDQVPKVNPMTLCLQLATSATELCQLCEGNGSNFEYINISHLTAGTEHILGRFAGSFCLKPPASRPKILKVIPMSQPLDLRIAVGNLSH